MIMKTASRTLITRVAMRPAATRAFSNCEPVERIRGVFETYRKEHFSDETPSRFKKHVIKAVQGPDNQGDIIQIDNLNQILENIGRSDARLSVEDQNLLLKEAGAPVEQRSIPVSKMMQLF